MQQIKKILILRFSSIGDIVLTTPVVRTLKTQLEGVEIHYCTKPQFASILENNPHVDQVHTLTKPLSKLIRALKKEQFDVIIDLHNNLRTKIIKLRLGVKSYAFNKLNWEKWLYVNFKINKLPNIHIVDRYMATTQALGVKMDMGGLDYFIPEKDHVELAWLPETHQKEYIALVVGARHATKRLPTKRLIELCDRINKPIVILGGKEDAAVGEEIEEFFK
ncbi:MAG: glycosyltransferase family 9 protein, partial [Flammeovirgaceae bacterium]